MTKHRIATRVRYWPDRLRLAWAVLCGRRFSLSFDAEDWTQVEEMAA